MPLSFVSTCRKQTFVMGSHHHRGDGLLQGTYWQQLNIEGNFLEYENHALILAILPVHHEISCCHHRQATSINKKKVVSLIICNDFNDNRPLALRGHVTNASKAT